MKEIWMKSSELFQKIETEKLETRNVCAQTWFKFQNRTSTEIDSNIIFQFIPGQVPVEAFNVAPALLSVPPD